MSTGMTSRERLQAVMSGRVPDRVPVSTYELVGHNPASFENREPSYRRLMDRIREKTDCVRMWASSGLARGELDGGTGGIGHFLTAADLPHECAESREGDKTVWTYTIETPEGPIRSVRSKTAGVETVWTEEHWLKNGDDISRWMSIPYVFAPPDCSGFGADEEYLGDAGIMLPDVSDALCTVADLFEFGEFTIRAMTETVRFREMLDAMHERVMDRLRYMLARGVRGLWRHVGAEYASEPYLPPHLFDELVVPYMRPMIELIHSHGQKVRVHSHGRLRNIVEKMIDCGADATDPCEAPPDGDVELAELKSRYGERLVLFGNMQLKHLETETPDQIEARVKDCMAAAKAGGGFVLMPTAAPINVPLSPKTEENYLRYIDAGLEYGAY